MKVFFFFPSKELFSVSANIWAQISVLPCRTRRRTFTVLHFIWLYLFFYFLWRTELLSPVNHWILPAAECTSASRCPLVRQGFSYSDLAAGALHAWFALGLLFTITAQLAHPPLTTMVAILEFVLLLLACFLVVFSDSSGQHLAK